MSILRYREALQHELDRKKVTETVKALSCVGAKSAQTQGYSASDMQAVCFDNYRLNTDLCTQNTGYRQDDRTSRCVMNQNILWPIRLKSQNLKYMGGTSTVVILDPIG